MSPWRLRGLRSKTTYNWRVCVRLAALLTIYSPSWQKSHLFCYSDLLVWRLGVGLRLSYINRRDTACQPGFDSRAQRRIYRIQFYGKLQGNPPGVPCMGKISYYKLSTYRNHQCTLRLHKLAVQDIEFHMAGESVRLAALLTIYSPSWQKSHLFCYSDLLV